jgi:drug/metabolite transporter (DMT)-like permease
MNQKLLLSIGYLGNLVLYILCLKAINISLGQYNIVFGCVIFGWFFPLALIYFIYNKMMLENINILLGLLDYIELLLLYIGLNELNVAEYISYRTLSIIFNVILSAYFFQKEFSKFQILGIVLILASCIILLYKGGINNFKYSAIVLLSSLIYSIIGFSMEANKETGDFIQIKLVSSFFNIMTYTFYSLFCNDIFILLIGKKDYKLILYVIFMGASEYIYYYLKLQIINIFDDGSIFTNILDIIRRIITLIISIIIFKETYTDYIYYCYFIIILGCILFYFKPN